ncbi:MAG: SPOR domain-containing protein [Deltaproteobacteria bacterium]|nr:SPOR domain-containing protein [Deltaproteobacteria bacterium]MBW1738033.1 SPOR domain-containing protein [Deltaproteobacteria bacterium]MBW1909487.1 SPOR domain-containing protein [Deltaproteobacteria bacterium]MBW2033704.1 SPOR domain-containing protein [Deltaproteobacteria bacterium]MBW2115706.1 SPOR domain-containing protein [Deltaproteobacteria bacterium]
MPPGKTRTPNKGKRYNLELSLTSVFFWSLGLFFLLGWIFVLGILVGRGFLPEGVKHLTELRSQITRLQEMVSNKKPSDLDVIKNPDKDPKFAFYDELSQKKEEMAKTIKQPIKKTAKEEVANEIKPIVKKAVALPEQDKPIEPVKAGPKYTVQIASLDSEVKAIRMANQMVDRGYPAYYVKAHVKGRIYFRVRCGKFESRKEAGEFERLLARREKAKGFVTRVDR